MDIKDIERLETLLDKATPGEWWVEDWPDGGEPPPHSHFLSIFGKTSDTGLDFIIADLRGQTDGYYANAGEGEANAQLIKELRNLAPQLISLAKQAMGRPVAGVTKDGVTVRLGQEVWKYSVLTSRAERLWACFAGFVAKEHETGTVRILEYKTRECYSTPEAARAAGENGGGDASAAIGGGKG